MSTLPFSPLTQVGMNAQMDELASTAADLLCIRARETDPVGRRRQLRKATAASMLRCDLLDAAVARIDAGGSR